MAHNYLRVNNGRHSTDTRAPPDAARGRGARPGHIREGVGLGRAALNGRHQVVRVQLPLIRERGLQDVPELLVPKAVEQTVLHLPAEGLRAGPQLLLAGGGVARAVDLVLPVRGGEDQQLHDGCAEGAAPE